MEVACVCFIEALPGVLGIQGEGLFIFRDLGRRVIYFQGFGEICGLQGAEEKHFGELGRKVIFLSGSKDPPWEGLFIIGTNFSSQFQNLFFTKI